MIIIETKDDLLKCLRNELVPKNPQVFNGGVKGILEYRINYRINDNLMHPDSIYEGYDKIKGKYYGKSITAECFEKIYHVEPLEIGSSDTIFNCWSYLNMFLRGVTGMEWVKERYALDNIDVIFKGYEALRINLDKLADYHHCLANFMPAPIDFNGSKSHDGKGNFKRDNDMPDLYYKRAKSEFPDIYSWINDKMEQFSLNFFKEYESFWEDGFAIKRIDVLDKTEMEKFERSIVNAINCIEHRAEELFLKMTEIK
ncbi:MAG: hypothetical protein OSJ61_25310 [Lachnospiraceae bacterium]|nr:hypothetical protein [Lachnospiraceae bacterium]